MQRLIDQSRVLYERSGAREMEGFEEGLAAEVKKTSERVEKLRKSDTIKSNGKVGDTDGYTTISEIDSFDFSDSKAVQDEVSAFIQNFAYSEVEHAVIISPDNKIYRMTGWSASVNTDLAGKDALRGAIVIHNHPTTQQQGFYDSFSKQDFISAVKSQTSQEILISGKKVHMFKIQQLEDEYEAQRIYDKAREAVFKAAIRGELYIEYEQWEIMKKLSEMDERVIFIEL